MHNKPLPAANKAGITALIIDDEVEACDNLKFLLHEYVGSHISIIGVAHDGAEAAALIQKLNPDFVFLDIEMPGENAFQFLKRIHPYDFEIIFVTAYDEFAVRAFKLNAVDYILKPIITNDLTDAVNRVRERIAYKQYAKNNDQQLDALKQATSREQPQKIALKSLNHVEVVDFKEIYSIEGQGSYCKICFQKGGASKEIITSSILSYYEELLPADLFFRVHKSYLVNCMHIKDILMTDNYTVVISNHEQIPVSRRRFTGFIEFLKEKNFYKL